MYTLDTLPAGSYLEDGGDGQSSRGFVFSQIRDRGLRAEAKSTVP